MARYGSQPGERWPEGRRDGGRFRPRLPATPALDKVIADLGRLSDADFRAGMQSLRASPDRENRLLMAKLDAELRRRQKAARRAKQQEAREREVDRLVAAGWDPIDAMADAYGLDPAKLARQQVDAAIGRRPGETRRQALRRDYTARVVAEVDQAEEDTAGVLLSKAGRAAGVNPRSLWSASPATARKYASEELLRWWEDHGGRLTFTEYQGQMGGGAARRQAQASRGRGAGRDYGT